MFKYFLLICTLSITIHSFAEKPSSLSQKLLKPLIQVKCGQELIASTLWKGASFFMNEKQKLSNKEAICGCVSEHAMDGMSAQDLLKASFNDVEKDKLVNQAIKNSLKGCAQQALK